MNLHRRPGEASMFQEVVYVSLRGSICHFSVGMTEPGDEQKEHENLNSYSLFCN